MKFRKKPVVIEAWQVLPVGANPIHYPMQPDWLVQKVFDGTLLFDRSAPDSFVIKTLEGNMRADPGDWIIQGVKGEIYPCKPDIFAVTYEPAE